MQFLQSHSYTLYTLYFLKNLTTRLYVSFYQIANKDCQRNYLRKKLPFFLKYLKSLKNTPSFEILGPRFTPTFKPFLRENGDKHEV